LLADPGDPVALSDTITGLLRDDSMRASMAGACRERAVELFSWDRMAETVAERYRGRARRSKL
jgi:glycosyltransferase involved in cell wall biosynthesis